MNILYFDSEDDLFHYTKLSTAIELILPKKRLKLSLLKDTNDPAEYKDKRFYVLGIREPFPDDTADRLDRVGTTVNSIYDKCGALYFCSNKKPTLIPKNTKEIEDEYGCSKGWAKSRMWSQYAEGHAGICLVFSKEKLEENLKKELGAKQPPIEYKTGYVKYYQHRSACDATNRLSTSKLANEATDVYATNHIKEKYEKFFYRKYIDYRDEAEYRMVIFNQEAEEYLDISSSIKGVIAGDKISSEYFPRIKKLCDSLGIKFLQARWNSGNWSLIPVDN